MASPYHAYASAPPVNPMMGMMPSTTAGGAIAPGAPPGTEQPKKPHLYVGNLSPRVTDFMLGEIFAVAGTVVSAKIVQDRNFSHGGFNYGFVEYMDMREAELALTTLNGRKIFDAEIRVNWAYQGQQSREDTQHHYHVFVGDLSPEVNDEVLKAAFGAFGSLSEARVMWDMNSGKSRGYGFLSFREKADADHAINQMNGQFLGNRAIRVNWANQKTQTGTGRPEGASGGPGGPSGGGGGSSGGGRGPGNMGSPMGGMGSPMSMHQGASSSYGGGGGYQQHNAFGGVGGGMPGGSMGTAPAPQNFGATALSYEAVAAQTPEYNTTVYVGNLIPYTTQADLIPVFQGYGYIVEIRMQADRGFAFVKLDTHQNAALAITHLQNTPVHSRPIKCSWGKDKAPTEGGAGPVAPVQPAAPATAAAYGQYPGYNYYGGYGYGQTGVPGQPGQHTAEQVAPAAAGAGAGAGAGAAGGQWDAATAAAYYQQSGGWGNYYTQDTQNNGSS